MSNPEAWKPTARLRWVDIDAPNLPPVKIDENLYADATVRVLQQWFAPDVPSYMIDPTQGEWRTVPVENG